MWGKREGGRGAEHSRDAATAAIALLTVRVARERGAIARFNDAVEDALHTQVPAAVLRALQVAIDELLTNVVMHADQAAGPIEVEIARGHDALETTIRYIAAAFDPTAWQPERHPGNVIGAAIGGRGIELVRALMDDFRYAYDDGRNVVRLRKRC